MTLDYQIILTNGGLVYNDLFLSSKTRLAASPHYLWVALKSRYREMNVWLSVCVMGLIMVSCALYNEPLPPQKSYLLHSAALMSSVLSPQSKRTELESELHTSVEMTPPAVSVICLSRELHIINTTIKLTTSIGMIFWSGSKSNCTSLTYLCCISNT